MSEVAQKIVSYAYKYYLNAILSKLIFKLKRAPQEYRLNPNSILKNLWEEICIQRQTDKWDGFNLVEDYLEAQISIILDNQPEHIKLILSFSDEDDKLSFNEEFVIGNILGALYNLADNYSSKSICRYLY
ncbi:hypothetical protein ACFOWA_15785 [Pedobacter lithocola]|uniref:Uncharacterized protein n=1 Tax=Pedobacter lithocola TaxID=1908239 RepID=A0ABV8PF61_9SPHI